MNNTMRISKYFEKSGLLNKRVSKAIENKAKNKENFVACY